MIDKKVLIVLLVAVLPALLPPGAIWAGAPAPCKGSMIKAAQNAVAPTLDWPASTTVATMEIGMNVFETLVSFNKKFEIIPMLATQWNMAPDGMSYTFQLRQNVKFHNGKEMTADDVVASVKRYMEVGVRRADAHMVKDVVAVDKHTVRFDLKEKTGMLLVILANPTGQVSIMPKEALYDKDGKFYSAMRLPHDREHLVGTGPYKFNEWLRDRYVSLKCFENYTPHKEAGESALGGYRVGYAEELRFHPVAEAGARIAGVETGQFHFGDRVAYELAMQVKDKPGVVVTRISPFNWIGIYFNHHPDPDGKPSLFSNLKMRQALQALLDMDEIMKAAGSGPGRLDPGLMFKESVFWSGAGKELYNQANPEKAKRLLREAGYDGREIRILTNQEYAFCYKSAVSLQEQLKRIGVPSRVNVVDWPTNVKRRQEGGIWDITFTGFPLRFDPSDHNLIWVSGDNPTGYSNAEVEGLAKAGMRESDFQKRYEIYKKLQQLTYDNVILMKEYEDNMYQIHSAKLKGYTPWFVMRLWNTWLEE
jgi:peptide/nickel transport system substrate-binding protein